MSARLKLLMRFVAAAVFAAFCQLYARDDDLRVYEIRNSSLVEVSAIVRTIPHSQPWKEDNLEVHRVTGVLLDDGLVLAGSLETKNVISYSVRLQNSEEYSALLIARDRELRLGVLRMQIPVPQSDDPANPIKPQQERSGSLRLPDRHDYTNRHVQWKCLSLDPVERASLREHTVFFENIGAAPSPDGNTEIPQLIFSGWNPGIRPGDLLVHENKIMGVVREYNASARYGSAVPSIFISQFVEALSQLSPPPAGELDVQPYVRNEIPQNTGTIVMDPGFRTVFINGAVQRSYLGLKPDTAALLVTDVLPFNPAMDNLLTGDVIISIDEKRIEPGGTLVDPVFGRIPAVCALILKNGRFRDRKDAVVIHAVRAAQIRRTSLGIAPFSQENYLVPASFDRPSFLVQSGLVFVELSKKYLTETPDAPQRLHYLAERSVFRKSIERERYVILDRILPAAGNRGYRTNRFIVQAVNGVAVINLSQLASRLEEAKIKREPVVLTLEGNRIIALDSADFERTDNEIRKTHGLPFLSGNIER